MTIAGKDSCCKFTKAATRIWDHRNWKITNFFKESSPRTIANMTESLASVCTTEGNSQEFVTVQCQWNGKLRVSRHVGQVIIRSVWGMWTIVECEQLRFTHQSHIPKWQVADFVSAIGGTLGLFMGMSFMSLFEIFLFIGEVFFNCFTWNCEPETKIVRLWMSDQFPDLIWKVNKIFNYLQQYLEIQ